MADELEWDDILDDSLHRTVFPRGTTAARVHWREIRSAVGGEGLKALLTYIGAVAVLLSGLWVCADTWADKEEGLARMPFVSMNLRLFWLLFLVVLGLFGWLLSGQVTKPWLRTYVVLGLVLLVLLLITIGRAGNFQQAASDARADARRLLQAHTSESSLASGALLLRLCDEGGIAEEDCTNSEGTIPAAPLEVDRPSEPLRCTTGWTLGAFDRWLLRASYDRQIVALRALTSCEIGLVDPAAQTAEGEAIDVEVVDTTVPESGEIPTTTALVDTAEAEPDSPPATIPGSEAVSEALQVQRSEVQAYEAVAIGADEILSFVSGETHFAEFRFSGAAWLVLLGLILFWYRHLEVRSGERRLGPVDVQFEAIDDGGGSSKDEGPRHRPSTPLEGVFKESVIRNVPEPGAVPGSGALAPVGDLVAESDLPQKTIISSAIDIVQKVFATRGGFTVTCSIRSTGAGCSVFVRLRDTRTGNHLASHLSESADAEEAARLAGFWIAGWILSRSAYVPSWASWSEEDAITWVRSGWEQGEAPSLARPSRRQARSSNGTTAADDLTTVNAMILAQRAYDHQLDERDANHFAALEDFARAVHRRPRYPVARYRRGVVLATMMLLGGDVSRAQGPAHAGRPPTASRLRYLFGDLILGADRETERVRQWCDALAEGEEFSPDMRARMLVRVAEWSNENRAALTWRWLARLRPSERFFWQSFSGDRLGRDWALILDLERLACIERLRVLGYLWGSAPRETVADRALEDAALKAIEARALEPDSHWQLSYGLGCLYAIRARRPAEGGPTSTTAGEGAGMTGAQREALNWLERSLDRPWSAQLVQEWITADGDLRSLRGIPEFETWVRRVPKLAVVPRRPHTPAPSVQPSHPTRPARRRGAGRR